MTDWPVITDAVTRELLGEPSASNKNELRFGRRGSLSVQLGKGVWFDHETGEGGGVIELVMRERQCSRGEALAWLEARRYIEPGERGASTTIKAAARTPPASPRVTSGATPQKHGLTASLWKAGGDPDQSPGRAYLALRFAWPPRGAGPALPCSVRWLDRANAPPGSDRAAKWYGLPDGAAGCLVFVYRHATTLKETGLALLAVSEAGERVLWFNQGVKICEVGQRKGAVFTAREAATADAPILACEGEINALALCLSPWAGSPNSRVVSVGPAGNMDVVAGLGRDVVLFADDDWPGRKAARKAAKAIRRFGHNADIQFCAGDPNDELAEFMIERAAIREYSGGASRANADKDAWIDLLKCRDWP